jgi:hypothetical protein
MTQAGTLAAGKLLGKLQAVQGLPGALSEIANQVTFEIPLIEPEQIQTRNVVAEVIERAMPFKYPAVFVYADRIRNEQKEKFRKFSGRVDLVAEVRLTQDRVDELESKVGAYVDAIADVLEASKGDWGDCVVFAGLYEVEFEAVKRGGVGFAQKARVKLSVHVSA